MRFVRSLILLVAFLITACGGGSGSNGTGQGTTAGKDRLAPLVAQDYNTVVQQLYIAYFGRPADPTGLANFTAQLTAEQAPANIQQFNTAYLSNGNIKKLIDSFGTSQESNALYNGGTEQFVTAIYTNVLGRAPDAEGLRFWIDAIDNKGLTKANASFSIMAGALVNNSPQGLADAALIRNRVAVASRFTDALSTPARVNAYSGNAAAATARAMLAKVTSSTDPAAFQSEIDSTIGALSSTNPTPPPTTAAPTVQFVKEAGEQKALIITKGAGGEAVTYGGERDATGALVALNEIRHRTAAGETVIDTAGDKVRKSQSPNGVLGTFELDAAGDLVIEFTEPGSGKAIKTKVSKPDKAAAVHAVSAAQREVTLLATTTMSSTASKVNQVPVDVTTSQCGKVSPVNGEIRVSLRAGEFSGDYRAQPVSPGVYRAWLPATAQEVAVSTENLKKLAETAKEILAQTCAVDPILLLGSGSLICTQVSAALAASTLGVGTPVAAAIMAGCESAVAASVAYCEFATYLSPTQQGVPDPVGDAIAAGPGKVADLFINAIPDNILEAEVTPYMVALPKSLTGETKKFSKGMTGLQLSIVNNVIQAGDIKIAPASPVANQGYTASALLSCVPGGSTANFSVAGTDGYTDQGTYTAPTGTSPVAEYTMTLNVPGAAKPGIQDTLKLNVAPSLGSGPIEKTTSLVFQ